MKGRHSGDEIRADSKAHMLALLEENLHPMTTDREEITVSDEGPYASGVPERPKSTDIVSTSAELDALPIGSVIARYYPGEPDPSVYVKVSDAFDRDRWEGTSSDERYSSDIVTMDIGYGLRGYEVLSRGTRAPS